MDPGRIHDIQIRWPDCHGRGWVCHRQLCGSARRTAADADWRHRSDAGARRPQPGGNAVAVGAAERLRADGGVRHGRQSGGERHHGQVVCREARSGGGLVGNGGVLCRHPADARCYLVNRHPGLARCMAGPCRLPGGACLPGRAGHAPRPGRLRLAPGWPEPAAGG